MNTYKSRWFVAFLCTSFLTLEAFGQDDIEEVMVTGSYIKEVQLMGLHRLKLLTEKQSKILGQLLLLISLGIYLLTRVQKIILIHSLKEPLKGHQTSTLEA